MIVWLGGVILKLGCEFLVENVLKLSNIKLCLITIGPHVHIFNVFQVYFPKLGINSVNGCHCISVEVT